MSAQAKWTLDSNKALKLLWDNLKDQKTAIQELQYNNLKAQWTALDKELKEKSKALNDLTYQKHLTDMANNKTKRNMDQLNDTINAFRQDQQELIKKKSGNSDTHQGSQSKKIRRCYKTEPMAAKVEPMAARKAGSHK